MIEFPCFCGEKFSLGLEMAGTMFQCEKCGLLVTVPTLDELAHLKPDGTYDIGFAEPGQADRGEQPELPADSSMQAASSNAIEENKNLPPRYDPFTGELVRAHQLAEHEITLEAMKPPRPPPVDKSAERQVLEPAPPRPALFVFGELFMARNVTVLLVMTMAYLALAFGLYFCIVVRAVMFFFMPLAMLLFCLSYFSTIVQETGPGEARELPAPLRHFDWKTDIYYPLIHILTPLLVCLLPAALAPAFIPDPTAAKWVTGVLAVIGAYILPSIFLTLSVNGILVNLRPDRLMKVMWTAPFLYAAVVAAWIAGTVLIINGIMAVFGAFAAMLNPYSTDLPRPFIGSGWIAGTGVIAAGLYFSFYACWLLGLIWRKHHDDFGWLDPRYAGVESAHAPPPAAGPKAA